MNSITWQHITLFKLHSNFAMHFKKEQCCLWVAQNLNSSIRFLIFINLCHLYNQKHFSVLTQPRICPSFFSPPPNLIVYVCCLPSLLPSTSPLPKYSQLQRSVGISSFPKSTAISFHPTYPLYCCVWCSLTSWSFYSFCMNLLSDSFLQQFLMCGCFQGSNLSSEPQGVWTPWTWMNLRCIFIRSMILPKRLGGTGKD